MNESIPFIFPCLVLFQKCTQILRYSLEVRGAQESKSESQQKRKKNDPNFSEQSSFSNRCWLNRHLIESMTASNIVKTEDRRAVFNITEQFSDMDIKIWTEM